MSRWNLKGSCVLITGGSAGIGLACAKELAGLGATEIAICGRRVDALEKAAAEVRKISSECNVHTLKSDVSTERGREVRQLKRDIYLLLLPLNPPPRKERRSLRPSRRSFARSRVSSKDDSTR